MLLLTTFSSTKPFILSGLFQLQEDAEKQRVAVTELEKHLDEIGYLRNIIAVPNGIAAIHNYWFDTKEARKSFCKYKEIEESLTFKRIFDVLFDGVVSGILAACLMKKFEHNQVAIFYATTFAAVTSLIHQYYIMSDVPHVSVDLKIHDSNMLLDMVQPVFMLMSGIGGFLITDNLMKE